ncbi:MAG: hypothetical protein AAGH60_15745 [Pseudomonadota bacterium]
MGGLSPDLVDQLSRFAGVKEVDGVSFVYLLVEGGIDIKGSRSGLKRGGFVRWESVEHGLLERKRQEIANDLNWRVKKALYVAGQELATLPRR